MRYGTVVASLVLVILLGGFAINFFSKNNTVGVDKPNNEAVNTTPTIMFGYDGNNNGTKANISKYSEYSKSVFEVNSNRRRVLFFYASWCSTCRPADANFKENLDKIPEDVVLIKVDYNDTDTDSEEKALAKAYGVTYQHTFIQIDESGKEVAKWNGGGVEEFLRNLK